jgi:Ca-activated chloride channel family protein
MPDFADPCYLLIALAVAPLIWLYIRREKMRFPSALFPTVNILKTVPGFSLKQYLRHTGIVMVCITIIVGAIAMARPQTVHAGRNTWSEGIDIVLALDISASMLAQDFTPNRVTAAKEVAANFIKERPDDRIGLVLFAKYAFTQSPLTIDHNILTELVDGVEVGLSDPDNTAIGQAIGSALIRLKASTGKSKVIILLTDGENNFGLPPMTAAEAAQAKGVRIYTIGIGRQGQAPYPATDMFGRKTTMMVPVSIDEGLLKQIAAMTGGKYFRATDNEKLSAIFSEIDQMEKTRIEVQAFRRYEEQFFPYAIVALAALCVGFLVTTLAIKGVV